MGKPRARSMHPGDVVAVARYEIGEPVYGPRESPGVGRPILRYTPYMVTAEIVIHQLDIDRLVRKAFKNNSKRSRSGPVSVKLLEIKESLPPCTNTNPNPPASADEQTT